LYESELSGDESVEEWANVLNNAARYMQTAQGKYDKAEGLNWRALEGCEKELGEQHPDTLTSVSNLALVLQYQGKYDEAEKMNRRALEETEKKLIKDHPNTLNTVYTLAYLLHRRKRYNEALGLYQKAYDGYKQKLVLGTQQPLHVLIIFQLYNKRQSRKDWDKVGS
jgi:tetratricopeptide (TPR) repeat protein